MEMSIHRALAELKLLDKRINKLISSSPSFCLPKKDEEKNINGDSLAQYKTEVQASYDSILDLIKRREKIKSKIMNSNAVTKIVINEEEMTVAEAIERKNTILYLEQLLSKMKRDYTLAKNQIEDANASLPSRLESFLQATLGDNPSTKEVEMISTAFIDKNELKMYDPINTKIKIEELDRDIDGFMAEIDFVLSESNSKTTISI